VYFKTPKIPTKEKRQRDSSENALDATHKNPKLELPPRRAKELCIIPSNGNPAAPIELLPPSFAFPSCIEHSGIAFIDKTGFIPAIVGLLDTNIGCFAAFPPKTGKTALMSMISAWLDCGIEKDKWRNLFERLPSNIQSKIAEWITAVELEKWDAKDRGLPPSRPKTFASARGCMCLLFDLNKVEEFPVTGSSTTLTRYIDVYLLKTIQDFLVKYQALLGEIGFSPKELESPVEMFEKLLVSNQSQ
jgi:hypothetical protein